MQEKYRCLPLGSQLIVDLSNGELAAIEVYINGLGLKAVRVIAQASSITTLIFALAKVIG